MNEKSVTLRRPAACLAAWILLAGGVAPRSLSAAEPARAAPPAETAKRAPDKRPLLADQARNYEKEPGTEPEDVALAVPRAVLAVPRFALKLLFYPIREGIQFLDRHAVVEKVTDVLYNDARTAAVVPTFGIDSYFGPSFGVKAFHDDLGGHDEHASAEARFGGVYKLATQLHFRADQFRGSRLWLESVARFESEPGLLFQGIGHAPGAADGPGLAPREASVATRYSEQRWLGLLRSGVSFGRPGELLQLGATGIYNVRDFGAKQRGRQPSIEQVYEVTRLVGFDERVPTLETDLNVIVDLRDVAGATASGTYLELFAGYVPRLGRYSFWHHGAELTGYIDLYRHTRVLVLRAFVEGVDGKDGDIPFAELPRLGGAESPARLRARSLPRRKGSRRHRGVPLSDPSVRGRLAVRRRGPCGETLCRLLRW